MKVTTKIAPVKGIGKPDYSRVVSAGRDRAGVSLQYNQQLLNFALLCTDAVAHPYPVSWVKDLIAIGGSAHLIDISTGLATPYTLPAGYTLSMFQKSYGANQDFDILVYYDGLLVLYPATNLASGLEFYANPVVLYSTATLDPTGASSHQVDCVVVNRGGDVLRGGFSFVAIIEAVGTQPLPATKDCQCPFCGHVQTVPVGTTTIVCAKCGETYLVQDLSRIRGL